MCSSSAAWGKPPPVACPGASCAGLVFEACSPTAAGLERAVENFLSSRLVDELAEREGKTAHAFMLEAIEEKVALTRQRQAFLDEGRAALHEIQAGGRTVSLDEMIAWMRTRACGEDIAPPQGT